jgi:prepilin-type N-terminal cleavage/methylation domain-containing protein
MSLRYPDKRLLLPRRGSRGLTLVELLVALAIGAAVVAGALAVLNQILILVPKAENNMLAIRQAQSAGYWIDRDATSAQIITPTPNLFTISTATPLVITYVKWDATKTTISYTVDSNRILLRQLVVTNEKTGSVISSNTIRVADSIASITARYYQPDMSNPRKILTVTIIAQVENSSSTRVYQISPRSF